MIGEAEPEVSSSARGAARLVRLDVEASGSRGSRRRSRQPLTSRSFDVAAAGRSPAISACGGGDLAQICELILGGGDEGVADPGEERAPADGAALVRARGGAEER